MKRSLYIICLPFMLALPMCTEPLYESPVDFFDIHYVFEDSIRSEAFINNMMLERPDEVNSSFNRLEGGSMLAAACDEATHVSTNKSARYAPQKMSSGNWGPSNMRYYRSSDDVGEVGAWYRWGGYYGIRKANTALKGLELTIPGLHGSQRFINRMKGEATFHKAMSHFWLFQKWGGIPLVDEILTEDNLNIPRATVQQTVDYILGLCDKAYDYFPADPYSANHEIGRYNRGCALALKSRLLLYAASPLYNGAGADGSGNPLICYGSYDAERWKDAAGAAQELVDLDWYSLYAKNTGTLTPDKAKENYAGYFFQWDKGNPEIIIAGRIRNANRNTESDNFPAGFTNAKGGTCPSQEMVDAYEMSDGTLFDRNDPVHMADPYKNRDPRFYASIIYHGAVFSKFSGESNYRFDISEGGINKSGNAATTTGYYLNKFMDYANVNVVSGSGGAIHIWSHFRHAETYLNLAEAGNEYGGPQYVVPGAKKPVTPVEAVNMVRARSGMPDVAATLAARGLPLNRETLRELIRNERRIELAFEEHRYYDVRRWMTIENGSIHGVKITGRNGTDRYEIIEVEKKVFDASRHYFFPIPYREIYFNSSLVQNPGWAQ